MSKTYTTTDRVYYYPPNDAPRVFVADKGVEIDFDLAVRLGLVKDEPKSKKVAETEVEDKKRPAPSTKKSTAKE